MDVDSPPSQASEATRIEIARIAIVDLVMSPLSRDISSHSTGVERLGSRLTPASDAVNFGLDFEGTVR